MNIYVAMQELMDSKGEPSQFVVGSIRDWLEAIREVKPNWSGAPKWANWWAVDGSGYEVWFRLKPFVIQGVTVKGECCWESDPDETTPLPTFERGHEVDLPLGYDWRCSLHQRPAE